MRSCGAASGDDAGGGADRAATARLHSALVNHAHCAIMHNVRVVIMPDDLVATTTASYARRGVLPSVILIVILS